MIAAVTLGEFSLFWRTYSADDRGAEMFGPLAGDQTDSSGRSVNQNTVARFYLIAAFEQISRSHTL
jgi:hypothetical protein